MLEMHVSTFKCTKPPKISQVWVGPLQTRQSERPWGVQPIHLAVDGWYMIGRRGPPVMQATREGHPVSQTMSNREAAAAFELSEHDNNLPVQWWNAVDGPESCSGRDHIDALRAVADHLDKAVRQPVLHNHHEASPALCQVVCSHALTPLMPPSLGHSQVDYGISQHVGMWNDRLDQQPLGAVNS